MRDQGSLLVVEPAPPPAPADRRAALALACVPGIGPARYQELAHRFDGGDRALHSAVATAARSAALAIADAALERADRTGAALLVLGDPDYPPPLLHLPDPPPALWALGDPRLLDRHEHALAVVGTRRMSPYGERTARALVAPAAAAGAVIVSGMAAGVDAVAHTVALDAAAPTVAVLGTGVDVPYPAAHRRLHARIAESGLVLSEQLPGAHGTAGAFPRRNRILAALARATLVVEAGHTSGALITAGVALELGRTVAAVPGPIDAERSAGCNRLIRDGATVVADAEDALMLVGLAALPAAVGRAEAPRLPELGDDERAVWSALAHAAPDVDALAAAARLPARRCVAALALLELAGLVETSLDGSLHRRA